MKRKLCQQQRFQPEICLRGVHKPGEALASQVFQVVAKGNQRTKGCQRAHFVFRPDHKWHMY